MFMMTPYIASLDCQTPNHQLMPSQNKKASFNWPIIARIQLTVINESQISWCLKGKSINMIHYDRIGDLFNKWGLEVIKDDG